MENLTPNLSSQEKFQIWVETNAPGIAYLWNWEKMEVNLEQAQKFLDFASHGEAVMARFMVGVWLGRNELNFDIFEARGVLDQKQLQVVLDWIKTPFWP